MKRNFPGVLWVLPIVFGVVGGTVAALIANIKYQASWWELFMAGLIITFLELGGYFIVWWYFVLEPLKVCLSKLAMLQ